ncbi:hypothetical protein GC093_06965 [Paenibacillus sp. LMG 31456]|uniref:Glycosyltransferase RgtA/B/C/D-like domain-containing protein n=1 Tax=Paenibacillus foliorum TaxID=2654974 RepID=A0A972JYW4_9BACL|nr:mannosyltransferase family protein [Paenibacillus foliorum]NOU92976.1 hypothetical protein [Paenibacillus foliorum]
MESSEQKQGNKFYWYPLMVGGLHILLSLALVFVVKHWIPFNTNITQTNWIEGFGSWDGQWYMNIAKEGYTTIQSTAFFPIYPLLLQIMSKVSSLTYLQSGLLISNVAFFFAIFFSYKFVEQKWGIPVAKKAIWLLAAFPTALFYHTVYTESLTLLTTVLFFYFLQKNKWYAAMISGFIATGVHDLGVVLAFPALFYLWKNKESYSRSKFIVRFLSISIIGLSLLFYMIFLYIKFGTPFAFVQAQAFWHREAVVPVLSIFYVMLKVAYKIFILGKPDWNYCFMMIVNAACTLSFVYAAVLMFRNKTISVGLKTFFGVTLLLSIVSGTGGDLQSFGRFMVVIFPGFIIMALKMKKMGFTISLISMLLLKFLLLGMFTNGFWVT